MSIRYDRVAVRMEYTDDFGSLPSSGLQVTQFFEAGKDFAAGELVYANIWHSAQDPAPCGAEFSVTFPH